MEQVRIVSAICENCGPKPCAYFEEDDNIIRDLPMTVPVAWLRTEANGKCGNCNGQVRIATEPAPTPQEASRGC